MLIIFVLEKISLRQQMVQLKSSEWGSRQQYWKYEGITVF